MLLNEIASVKTINQQMAEFGTSVRNFRKLYKMCGFGDDLEQILEVKFLGWQKEHNSYAYVMVNEGDDEDDLMVAYFYASFNKDGSVTGDHPGVPAFETNDRAEADHVFDKTKK